MCIVHIAKSNGYGLPKEPGIFQPIVVKDQRFWCYLYMYACSVIACGTSLLPGDEAPDTVH